MDVTLQRAAMSIHSTTRCVGLKKSYRKIGETMRVSTSEILYIMQNLELETITHFIFDKLSVHSHMY